MEQRIQKAVNFLKSPKGKSYTVSNLPYEKKIEFLKTKLSSKEIEEVLKRIEENTDFNKFFEPNPVSEQQPAPK